MCRQSDTADIELDVEPLSETIQEYPVRCAIRYGSHAHGTATGDSNVDIAVAFERGLSEAERFDRRQNGHPIRRRDQLRRRVSVPHKVRY
jgi:predicted nucleotidyltransferase